MATSSFVSLSGQLALDRRLSTIANNIANAKTAGYRASGVNFGPIVSSTAPFETVFASAGGNHINMASGAFARTSNALDVAIQGEGFFAIQSPTGTYYSRDGRLSLTEAGELVNTLGHQVMDAGGAPISLDPKAGPPVIQKDGGIYQNGQKAAQLGLYQINTAQGFTRSEGSGIVPSQPAELITDYMRNGVAQGFVEDSNVNSVTEMVKLIQVTRAFEAASTMSDKVLESEMEAIRTLGSR
ncbi:MAG: flagellar basal-body rod protein FlgF [Proteobacteria bacterium]|nr:flagellar basal-body rod protein FlgF [Pseudomonadota bacterium]